MIDDCFATTKLQAQLPICPASLVFFSLTHVPQYNNTPQQYTDAWLTVITGWSFLCHGDHISSWKPAVDDNLIKHLEPLPLPPPLPTRQICQPCFASMLSGALVQSPASWMCCVQHWSSNGHASTPKHLANAQQHTSVPTSAHFCCRELSTPVWRPSLRAHPLLHLAMFLFITGLIDITAPVSRILSLLLLSVLITVTAFNLTLSWFPLHNLQSLYRMPLSSALWYIKQGVCPLNFTNVEGWSRWTVVINSGSLSCGCEEYATMTTDRMQEQDLTSLLQMLLSLIVVTVSCSSRALWVLHAWTGLSVPQSSYTNS